MIVKICGFTRPDDAAAAVAAGADWIGLNFWPGSKRWINIERGVAIARAAREARPDVVVVGVFVNQGADGVERIAGDVGLDRIQLHGDETPDDCTRFGDRGIRALAICCEEDIASVDAYPGSIVLLDAPCSGYGGSGESADWSLATRAVQQSGKRVVLAGGLTPDNVRDAIRTVAPWGVDVASGVESAPGIKDPALVAQFIAAAKGIPL